LTRPVDLGQVVGGQSVIYEIAPLADVEVEADVDERFLAEVREGQKADLLIAGLGRPVRATLDYISPKVDPRTGGAKVRFSLDEQVEGLRSGLTADVNLIVEQRARALTVPRASILGRDAAARVLVVGDDGRVQERPVRFIEWPSDRVIVTDGLRAGERLLAQPRPDLVGERVAALPPPEGAAMPRGSAQQRSLAASNNLTRPL
jgi:RND family efflux transporter MFP subunit